MGLLIWLAELWAPAIARGGADRKIIMAAVACPHVYSYWIALEDDATEPDAP